MVNPAYQQMFFTIITLSHSDRACIDSRYSIEVYLDYTPRIMTSEVIPDWFRQNEVWLLMLARLINAMLSLWWSTAQGESPHIEGQTTVQRSVGSSLQTVHFDPPVLYCDGVSWCGIWSSTPTDAWCIASTVHG